MPISLRQFSPTSLCRVLLQARTRVEWPFCSHNGDASAQFVRGVPIVGTKGHSTRVRAWRKTLQSEVGLSCRRGIGTTIPIKPQTILSPLHPTLGITITTATTPTKLSKVHLVNGVEWEIMRIGGQEGKIEKRGGGRESDRGRWKA
ncbi:hypothetical protein ACH5RR_026644 [Cinchona calisaya]|uniref:Ribosomal protein L2 n=1 Tax=Cinchona calisaya TaxID=153742 RepID=A0ABD2Z362_9GENT